MNSVVHSGEDAVPPVQIFRCPHEGCGATFSRERRLREHQNTHTGEVMNLVTPSVLCPQPDCQIVTDTWGKMCKHLQEHTVTYTCKECQKSFGKRGALRRHKRSHGLQKPVLRCTSPDCKAYFTTTFNLQHHIRKVHLQLLKYPCNYPECSRAFAMRVSTLVGVTTPVMVCLQRRVNKSWRKRLERHKQWPLVEDDLSNLFALRMRLPRCLMLEANLTRLFNERLIPHPVEPEVNLRDLFNLKPDHALDATQPSF
uniref:P43 5S RNA-binding protein n=1 Tax=Scleropages formosus TaxID=113540 RepID=A0A8C9TZV2_SCLFO